MCASTRPAGLPASINASIRRPELLAGLVGRIRLEDSGKAPNHLREPAVAGASPRRAATSLGPPVPPVRRRGGRARGTASSSRSPAEPSRLTSCGCRELHDPLPGAAKQLELRLASEHRAARDHLRGGGCDRLPRQPRRERRLLALDRDRLDRLGSESPPGRRTWSRPRSGRLPRGRDLLKAPRRVHRVPHDGELATAFRPDGREHHLSAVDPHPESQAGEVAPRSQPRSAEARARREPPARRRPRGRSAPRTPPSARRRSPCRSSPRNARRSRPSGWCSGRPSGEPPPDPLPRTGG